MKKLFTIFLCIIILGALTIPVDAVTFEAGKEPTYYTSGDFSYLVTYEGITYITGYYGEAVEEVVIPAILDDHEVDGFWLDVNEYFADVKSIVISEGISTIHSYTFQSCSNLESITVPTTVTLIGEGAFAGCSSLKTVIYNGTEEQFAQVVVEEGNELLLLTEKIFLNTTLPSMTPSVTEEPSPEATVTPKPEATGPHMSDVWVLIGMLVVFGLCMVGFYFLRK